MNILGFFGNMNLWQSIVVIVLPLAVIGVGLTKLAENKLIKMAVPLAIDFAEKLGGKNKLIRAVTFVENYVLTNIPVFLRPLADFLISPQKIADWIERELTKIKGNETEKKRIVAL